MRFKAEIVLRALCIESLFSFMKELISNSDSTFWRANISKVFLRVLTFWSVNLYCYVRSQHYCYWILDICSLSLSPFDHRISSCVIILINSSPKNKELPNWCFPKCARFVYFAGSNIVTQISGRGLYATGACLVHKTSSRSPSAKPFATNYH